MTKLRPMCQALVARLKFRRLRNSLTICVRGYNTPAKMGNLVVAKLSRMLRLTRVPSVPYQYIVDPAVGICNLKCPMCITGLGISVREPAFMSLEEFREIVNEIKRSAYRINLYNWGEPFLHPSIFDMIAYAHQHGIFVQVSSNMEHFDREMARRAVSSGLDSLIVPIEGDEQVIHESFRRGGHLSTVVKHLEWLQAEKKRVSSPYPVVTVRMIVTWHNEHRVDEVHRIARGLHVHFETVAILLLDPGDPTQVQTWLPHTTSLSRYDRSRPENVHACDELWKSMNLYPNGGIAPCCWPAEPAADFGNLHEQPLFAVWNNQAYQGARSLFGPWGTGSQRITTVCTACQGRPVFHV